MIIKNARVLNDSFVFEKKDLFIRNDRFVSDKECDSSKLIDAKSLTALPGLVDIHFHGAAGHDFMEGTCDAIKAIASYEALRGITSITPATMTMSEDAIIKASEAAASFVPSNTESSLEGIYMEGPFVSEKKLGAQNSDYVKTCDASFFERVLKSSDGLIKNVVVAPETDGALEFIEKFSSKVRVSLGHTACDYDTACRAFTAGAKGLTHTFNAMNPLHHRAPGPIAAASDSDCVLLELISDGVHIHESMIRALFKLASGRVILISDSMAATGLDDGESSLGGQTVYVKGNMATLKDGTLAGSVTNLFDCMKYAVKSGIALETAVKSASYNPALAFGLEHTLGSIKEGLRADLLLVDDSLNLRGVILRGNTLFFN